MRGLVHEAGKWNIFSLPWYDVNIIYLLFIFLHITWIQVETQIDTLTCTCGIVNKLLACTSGVVNKLFAKNFVTQLGQFLVFPSEDVYFQLKMFRVQTTIS